MLCHVMLWYDIQCYAMLCHVMLCRVILCYALHTILCHTMPCHAMPCHAMLCYAMLCYAMLVWCNCCDIGVIRYGLIGNCNEYWYKHEHMYVFAGCTCDPRGVESGNCDHRGRCRCKPNFTGINCNRCKPGHFQFPNCKRKYDFISCIKGYGNMYSFLLINENL